MSKLTRVQRQTLETTLYHLKRAQKYLANPKIAVCHRDSFASTTLHYSRADGSVLYEVEKAISSDLCGIEDAVRRLEQFLEPEEVAA